jgi:hypothetical protein
MSLFGGPKNQFVVNVARDSFINLKAHYDSAFLQDTITSGNLTANVGLRYDKQGGSNNPQTVAANRFRPDLLPTVNYPGGPAGFEWKSVLPRLGLTYALGGEHKTLLRASFSQFADQLGTGTVSQLNPLGLQSYAYFYYQPTPVTNGSLPGCCTGPADAYSANVNPLTGALVQSNQVASNLKAPVTSEVLLSVEHALLPEFTVGLNVTYRELKDLLESDLLVFDCPPGDPCATSQANLLQTGRRAQRSDFHVVKTLTGTLPTGGTYSLPVYGLVNTVDTRGGTDLVNGSSKSVYKGASLVLTKRLSNRWMMRGNISVNDWKWDTPSSAKNAACFTGAGCGPNRTITDDGQEVIVNSGAGSGSKGNVYVGSKWSYSFNGLYQIAPDRPWGFNVAGTLTGREGYPVIYLRNGGNLFHQGATQLPVTDNDAVRMGNINQLDTRIEKDLRFSDLGVTLSVDCFNVLNRSTVLQRRGRLNSSTSDDVQEIVSPRLFRLGAKFSFH